jgi:phytoene dehydrogenase-like protein
MGRLVGGCSTAAVTQSGFLHDLGSSTYPLGAASPFYGSLPFTIPWIQPHAAFAHPLDDGTAAASAEAERGRGLEAHKASVKGQRSFTYRAWELPSSPFGRTTRRRGGALNSGMGNSNRCPTVSLSSLWPNASSALLRFVRVLPEKTCVSSGRLLLPLGDLDDVWSQFRPRNRCLNRSRACGPW